MYVEKKKHVKIVLNDEDTEKFDAVKEWLGASSDAEVLRILLNRGHALLKKTGSPFELVNSRENQ